MEIPLTYVGIEELNEMIGEPFTGTMETACKIVCGVLMAVIMIVYTIKKHKEKKKKSEKDVE
jgi:hypothetical protein